ncbi:MAG TPA: amidohydrolase [Firmicutes bacterium]|nr:amidohydrolase [Bacillota bacterium]
MNNLLITGATIVTIDDQRPDYFSGDLLVEGDKIAGITEHPESIDPDRAQQVIQGDNLIVLPGLINAHGHAAMTLFRGYADDLPLMRWLEEKIWPAENSLTGDDVYWGTMLAIAEMLKGGTTTFTDMYFFMDRVAEAVAESKMRAVLSRGLAGVGLGSGKLLKEAESFINTWQGRENGRINTSLGPHAPYTCPPRFMKKVMEIASRTGRPLQIHLSETTGEVERCRRKHGCTPIQLMDKIGLFQFKVIAAHCVHLNGEDISILAQHGVGVAHNPGSNLKLGSGVAPLTGLLQAGVKVALGTDGAGSNNNLDLWEEIYLAALLSKGVHQDPTLIPAKLALKMATSYGAEVLRLPRLGKLKEGYQADIIGVRKDAPHLKPIFDPLAHLVYTASAADVQLVMVDGQILVDNGELTGLDEERIMFEASKRAYLLTGRKG